MAGGAGSADRARADGYEVAGSREAFFAKPQACLRASPLVKQFGWGIHHDAEGRVALLAIESEAYRTLLDDPAVRKTPGMRSKR